MIQLSKRFVEALQSVLGDGPVGLHEPLFAGNEKAYLQECIDTSYVSSVGPFVDRFESELCSFTGAPFAVAVVNGTEALHVALLLAGVRPGDEVLVPALSFVATANAVYYCGASPHFVDVDEPSLGMDPVALRRWLSSCTRVEGGQLINVYTGSRIRAMIPMHTFGLPCDVEGIEQVANDFGISVVEDAAEALGSYVGSTHVGNFGALGILSFNGNKVITTGGGGAILTSNEQLARRARHLTTTARLQHAWRFVHDEVGFNYRMPNLNAALGCAQLEQVEFFLASKRTLFGLYEDAFRDVPHCVIAREGPGRTSNYWLQTVVLDDAASEQLDEILNACNESGYKVRPAWTLLPDLAPYNRNPKAPLPVASSLTRRIINLPSSADLPIRKSPHWPLDAR